MEPSRAPGPQRLATSPRQQHQVTLRYDRGTLLVEPTATRDTGEPTVLSRLARERGLDLRWDARVASHRAPGYRRAALHEAARRLGIALADHCAKPPSIAIRAPELRDYQVAALDAWRARLRGLVVLPTGAGKTLVALGAMAALGRAALVLVPTRVLLAQWQARLREVTGGPVGVMGDGCRALAPVTVSTYASAYAHIDHWGDRFALLVVDEAHHFGGGQHTEALQMCSAPARLGLTATPPVTAEGLALLDDLIGPVVFSQSIGELAGAYLAPFDHIRLHVDLSPAERAEYVAGRARFVETYQRFRHSRGGAGWGAFIAEATQSDAGRRALEGHFQSRRVVATAAAKLDLAAQLIAQHRDDRVLVFTADNLAAYALSRRLLIPAITCDIVRGERAEILDRLRDGRVRAVVSSRVLNEGVDLPEARVGVVVGGTHGVREHVQRVGRLLRPGPGKRAAVYELVARDTFEVAHARARQLALVG